ncbi:hypothetical protein [Mucilaginibacter sp.]|uniref:hypothetical protein n=1 Tax=Mucilaginibacter sp. TaxID=1882438 RepID=UPI003D09BCF3
MDWKLLLFLLLFLDVKLAVKIAAIVVIYLLQFDFKFGFSLKSSRIPLFYLLILVIPFVGLIINRQYSSFNYLIVFFTGLGFWLLCILATHQIKLSVERNNTAVIHQTILVFFITNAVFSFYNIAHIIYKTGVINPYRYQGERQKYFISTGDYIRGLAFDTSTTNAVINAFGVVYFLVRKSPVMVLACMAILLLTGSNFTNITLVFVLALLFIFNSSKDQKSLIALCLMLLVVFMGKISPQNNKYTAETFVNIIRHPQPSVAPLNTSKQVAIIASPDEVKQDIAKRYLDSISKTAEQVKKVNKAQTSRALLPKTDNGRILITQADINALPFQSATDTTPDQQQLLSFIDAHRSSLPLSSKKTFLLALPGKAMGIVQTAKFLMLHPAKIITGDGIGNFSSKLAFRATGFGFAGGYPARHVYINPDFLTNHLDIYLDFFSKRAGNHSLTNSPYSVYDQLIAEYGLIGIIAFFVYYLGFFARHYKILTYGLPLLFIMSSVFFIDYWFEQLSVVVLFELLLFLNIKEHTEKTPLNYAH